MHVGGVQIGGGAPVVVQSMTCTDTADAQATLAQVRALAQAGCDIVRVSVPTEAALDGFRTICAESPVPIVADIHFNHKLAIGAVEAGAAKLRINPGNIGGKDNVKEVVQACKARKIPIRIGVNHGSIEKEFADKYGYGVEAMLQSALYNIKLLEDFDFTDIKISMKCSNAQDTIEAYERLRPLCEYPFHLGVTEAGTRFHSTIKSSIALGNLLLKGIGDTVRVSMTGELEEEIRVAKAILQDSGVQKSGVNIISCPTCGRIQSDLVKAIKIVEEKVAHIKAPLNISVMGCVVNALGEAKGADVAIAFGKNQGLVIRHGEVVAKLKESELVERFLQEVEDEAKSKEA